MSETIKLDVSLPKKRLALLMPALGQLNGYISEPNILAVLELWPTLPDEVRGQVISQAPTFAILVQIVEKLNGNPHNSK